MSTSTRKGVTPDQLKRASDDLNLTVSAIADSTGFSKAYVSEFRSKKRNFTPPEQARLRTYLEAQYKDAGQEFPEVADTSSTDLPHTLGSMVQRITRPAILLSDDVPKALSDKLLSLIDTNRIKVDDILGREFQDGGFFGGEFAKETEESIRELFAMLALNYIVILMLQGRNIVRQVGAEYPVKTMGDWLSKHISTTSPLGELLPSDEPTAVKTTNKTDKVAV